MDVHVGRQPIFDRSGHVIGHELLFRDGVVSHARVTSAPAATAQVLLAAFLDLGLDALVGDGMAFVNLPRPFIVGTIPMPVHDPRVVLELLEDVGHDDELLDGVQRLREQGHRLALDDFVWNEHTAALLPYVEIVKIDVLQHGADVPDLVRRCHAAGVTVVAEKIETAGQLRTCRALSVAYYQGYLLQRPQVLTGQSLSTRQLSCLALVRALASPGIEVGQLVELVRRDPGLCFRLLQAANGAGIGLPRRVSAVREAVLLLGFGQLRRWALLMLVADLPAEAGAAVEAALLRASMCERLAAGSAAVDPEEAFVVGLLSGLDLLLGRPIVEVLAMLALAEPSERAILCRQGPLGEVLSCVLSYEQGSLAVPQASGLPEGAPREAFLGACASQRQELLVS